MTFGSQESSNLEDIHRGAMERVGQERTERRIFIREVAIVLFVAAVVVVRFTLGA